MPNRRKKNRFNVTENRTEPEPPSADVTPRQRRIRRVTVGFAVVHLAVCTLSLMQPIGLPETFDQALAYAQPYLRATRFGADGKPARLPHGRLDEAEIRVQVSGEAEPAESDWLDIDWGSTGVEATNRRQRFFSAAATLAENEQYGLVARWLRPLISGRPEAESIRMVRVPTLLSDVVQDNAPPVYQARILRRQDEINLANLQPTRLVAIAVDEDASSPSGGGDTTPPDDSPNRKATPTDRFSPPTEGRAVAP